MSTEQFDYVLGLVEPHISRLLTVYVAVYVQGRTTQYDVVCSVNAEVVNAPTVNPCPGNGFFATFTGNGGGGKNTPRHISSSRAHSEKIPTATPHAF